MGDSAPPEALLAKLEPDRDIAVGSVRGLGAALPLLVAAGWIEVRTQGRAQVARLTVAGAAKRAQVPPRARRRTEGPSTGSARAITADALAARVAELEAQVQALTARVAELEGKAPAIAPIAPVDLASTALSAIAELDARGRYGGLVPIPAVRAALRDRGADDPAISATLLDLERQFRIDLSIAQSPTTAPDRSQGIERPGRGLLYYVARR